MFEGSPERGQRVEKHPLVVFAHEYQRHAFLVKFACQPCYDGGAKATHISQHPSMIPTSAPTTPTRTAREYKRRSPAKWRSPFDLSSTREARVVERAAQHRPSVGTIANQVVASGAFQETPAMKAASAAVAHSGELMLPVAAAIANLTCKKRSFEVADAGRIQFLIRQTFIGRSVSHRESSVIRAVKFVHDKSTWNHVSGESRVMAKRQQAPSFQPMQDVAWNQRRGVAKGPSSNTYPTAFSSSIQMNRNDALDDRYGVRCRARRPKSTAGLAARGRTAGLPRRSQTDPRMYLPWQDMCATLDAERFAASIGLPLTAHITVAWRNAEFKGGCAEAWEREHRRFIRKMTDWLKANAVPVAHLFIRERVVGRGGHTHFLVHIPQERWGELKPALESHLQAVLKRHGYTDPNPLKITGDRWNTPGMVQATQRIGLLRYLAKAMNPNEVLYTGAGVRHLHDWLGIEAEQQASVPCKRVGWSEKIGEAARLRAGWRDSEDVLRLSELLAPCE